MQTKHDIEELDLDTLDTIMGGSAPLPVGLGSNSMPQHTLPTTATTTAIPGVSTAGASSSPGYQDHFGLHFGGGGGTAAATDGGMPVPSGMGGSGAGAGDGHGGGNGGGFAGATDSHSSDSSSHGSDHQSAQHYGQDVGVNGAQSAFDVVDQAINTIDNAIQQFAGPQGLGQTS